LLLLAVIASGAIAYFRFQARQQAEARRRPRTNTDVIDVELTDSPEQDQGPSHASPGR
jgi:hypothetical protein